MSHEMERASTLSGCAFVEIASPNCSTRSLAHGPPRPPIAQLSGSKSSCPSHDIGTWTRASENDRAMEVLIIKEDPARTLASVPPGLVQKILNFLPLDKVHETKQVSKLYRSAAHSAMTRGRWKPVRLVAEHYKHQVRPPALALCRAAWDLDPSETLRLKLKWPSSVAAQFLALVEPSLDGLERILKVCERKRSVARVCFIITDWAKLIGTPIFVPGCSTRAERRALVLRCLSRALRSWTDAAVAADFFSRLYFPGGTPKLVEFTRNWEDGKASAFAAALVAARARQLGAQVRRRGSPPPHLDYRRPKKAKGAKKPRGAPTSEYYGVSAAASNLWQARAGDVIVSKRLFPTEMEAAMAVDDYLYKTFPEKYAAFRANFPRNADGTCDVSGVPGPPPAARRSRAPAPRRLSRPGPPYLCIESRRRTGNPCVVWNSMN